MGAEVRARSARAQPNAMSTRVEGFPPAHAAGGAGVSGELEELQGFSKHLLAKLDESRNMGQFSQAEIELLRKKLSVVVNAFSAERAKRATERTEVRSLRDLALTFAKRSAKCGFAMKSSTSVTSSAKSRVPSGIEP